MSLLGSQDEIAALLEDVHDTVRHVSSVFPANTNLTCTLTANATANTYNSWVEVADSASAKLSSVFASYDGHITSMLVENQSEADTIYMYELSHGESKIVIVRGRFAGGTKFQAPDIQNRFWAPEFPAGCTVYYRMKTDTGVADTCSVHFRYHLHE